MDEELQDETQGQECPVNVDMEEVGPWEFLPSVPLQKIYAYVSRRDQTNMSLVCKNWTKDFCAPGNWRKIQFIFSDRAYTDDICPVVKFARRYGHMIRELEIICRNAVTWLSSSDTNHFELFVNAVSETSRIYSITFINYKNYFQWLDDELRGKALRSVIQLLLSQSHLRSLEFDQCEFRRWEAVAILQALFVDNGPPLKRLKHKKLLSDREMEEDSESEEEEGASSTSRLRWVMPCLRHLEEWEGDYNHFMEDVVEEFPNILREHSGHDAKSPLMKMLMKWDGWTIQDIRGISSESWKAFHQFCPKLEVDFVIGVSGDPSAILQKLLPRFIPLRCLNFQLTTRHNSNHEDYSTGNFFNHMLSCKLNENLQELHMVWMKASVGLEDELDNFVRRCPKLKTLSVQVSYPLMYLENLLQTWIRECPQNVRTVFLTVCNIPSEERRAEMYEMADNYLPVLQVYGVNFCLILETTDFRA